MTRRKYDWPKLQKIAGLKESGLTYKQIGERESVSRHMVPILLARYGHAKRLLNDGVSWRDAVFTTGIKDETVLPLSAAWLAKERKLSESALQIAVVEHLRRTGVPGLLYFSIPNEGKRTPANGARMKAMGLLPGVADLFVKAPKRTHAMFLELKNGGKKPRGDQLAFADAAFSSGCAYSWADNIDDALKILRDYGAIRSK